MAAGPGRAMAQQLTPRISPGPFYPAQIPADHDWDLVRAGGGAPASGDIVLIEGRVMTAGSSAVRPLAGAIVEIWQADANGRYIDPRENFSNAPRDPGFQGYGTALTDAEGRYRFRTIKPPAYPVPFPSGPRMRAPHIHFGVIVGGQKRLITQMFFAGESLNDGDFELATVDPERRREVIIPLAASAVGSERRANFDLVLGG